MSGRSVSKDADHRSLVGCEFSPAMADQPRDDDRRAAFDIVEAAAPFGPRDPDQRRAFLLFCASARTVPAHVTGQSLLLPRGYARLALREGDARSDSRKIVALGKN